MSKELDLSMVYVIKAALVSIKKEMDEKGMSFDDFLNYYDESIKMMEEANETGAHF